MKGEKPSSASTASAIGLAIAILGGGIGGAAVLVWQTASGPNTSPPPVAGGRVESGLDPTAIGSVREALRAAQRERQVFAEEIEDLWTHWYALERSPGDAPDEEDVDDPAPRSLSQLFRALREIAERTPPAFDTQGLLDAGLDPAEVARLTDIFEEWTSEMIRHQQERAMEEDWLRTERFRGELHAMNGGFEDLRELLGDEAYDTLLFGARRATNRVRVRLFWHGSAAREAGLRVGDVILSIDDRRVFSSRDIENATGSGYAGEVIPIEIDRSGVRERFYVPRAPLGMAYDTFRGSPATAR